MYQPHNVHQIVNAVHDDYRRATRQPSAWSEASETLVRPPWQGMWRMLLRWMPNWREIYRRNHPHATGYADASSDAPHHPSIARSQSLSQ